MRSMAASAFRRPPRDCGKSLTLLAQSFTTRCVSTCSQAKLNALARRLNERPRKTLDFQTPAEMFQSDRCIDRLNPHSLAAFSSSRCIRPLNSPGD